MTPASPPDNESLQQRISELEQSLQTAQEQIALLQGVIDTLPDVIYATDQQGRIRVVNSAFATWVDRPREEIVDKATAELFPSELVAFWDLQFQAIQSTRKPLIEEEQVPNGDAMSTYLSQRFPLLNQEGDVYAIVGTATDISDRKQAENALRENQRILRAIIDNAPAVIYVKSPDGQLLIVNQLYGRVIGRPVDEIMGKYESDLFPADLVAAWRESEKHFFEQGQPIQYPNVMEVDGKPHDFLTTQFPLYDEQRQPYAICGISLDVTELRQTERERAALQEEVIAAQQAALRELSTPLIPIDDEMLVMPLIGSMDGTRAQQVMETLLTGVVHHNATTVILDITGLPMVDTQVANVLLQATKAARLVGAEVILTGVRAEVAQTLISLGADLGDITTPGTLQSGIAYALQRRSRGTPDPTMDNRQ